MRLLADANVDRRVVVGLRREGHDILHIAATSPRLDDPAVLRLARSQGRILITLDKDFGELVFRERRSTAGILLVRLRRPLWREQLRVVRRVLSRYGPRLPGRFTVTDGRVVRSRPIH